MASQEEYTTIAAVRFTKKSINSNKSPAPPTTTNTILDL